MDTAVAQCVQPPVVSSRSTVSNNSYMQPSYSNSPPQSMQPQSSPLITRPPMTCFGCGEVLHPVPATWTFVGSPIHPHLLLLSETYIVLVS
jgi:hypothetical protein